MPNHGISQPSLANAIASRLRQLRASAPWARRRQEKARLAFTELDIRRIDNRIDNLLEILAQLCDYSGQFDTADDFRALTEYPPQPESEAEADRQFRLMHGK